MKNKVIFIVGSGHCGSTLLELLLGAHSSVTSIGELQEVDRGGETEIWKKFLPFKTPVEIFRGKLSSLFGFRNFRFYKTKEKVDEGVYQEWNELLFSLLSQETGSSVIVDSSKNIERVDILSRRLKEKALVIHLVRDGRGVTWSYVRKYPSRILFALSVWFFSNLKVELFKLTSKAPVVRIRYEDLVDNPKKVLENVLHRMDLSFEEQVMGFAEVPHPYHIGGNRMKKKKSSKIVRDEKWRRDMPARYLFVFWLLFGWLNVYYRYI